MTNKAKNAEANVYLYVCELDNFIKALLVHLLDLY